MRFSKPKNLNSLASGRHIEDEDPFLLRIVQEWRRAERSNRPELLIIIEGLDQALESKNRFLAFLSASFRETDIFGWLRTNTTLGIILPELGKSGIVEAYEAVLHKINNHIQHEIDHTFVKAEAYVLPSEAALVAESKLPMMFRETLLQLQTDTIVPVASR